LIAPNGNHYTTNYALVAYQFQTIYNATTKTMTGARIFTVDGTTFAAAWGEDPSVAGTGSPYMDAGTGIIPFPQPTMTKTSTLVVDQNGDGKPGWGDTLEYTVHMQNQGMLVLGNVLVLDALPNTVTYVTNSTTLNGVSVTDNLVPPAATAFPLDESGLVLPQIQAGGYTDVKYRVVINAGATSVSNAVMGSAGDQPVTSSESVIVAGPVTLAFTDASGNPVSSYVTNSGVYVSLTDLIQNTNANTAQTVTVTVTNLSGGDVESVVLTETGTNTGIFRNTTPLLMSTTAGGTKLDGTLHALAGNFLSVTYTDPISSVSGSATATVTAAPLPFTTKSSQLVVDQNGDGRIGWGDTVQYSILLTNTNQHARDHQPGRQGHAPGQRRLRYEQHHQQWGGRSRWRHDAVPAGRVRPPVVKHSDERRHRTEIPGHGHLRHQHLQLGDRHQPQRAGPGPGCGFGHSAAAFLQPEFYRRLRQPGCGLFRECWPLCHHYRQFAEHQSHKRSDSHSHANQPFRRGRGITHADRNGNQYRRFPQRGCPADFYHLRDRPAGPKSTRKKGQNLKLIDRVAPLTFRANQQHVLNHECPVQNPGKQG
jgi:uncharacterized repeat protein (TIGR01451 family)